MKKLQVIVFLNIFLFNQQIFSGNTPSIPKVYNEYFFPDASTQMQKNLLRRNLNPENKNFFVISLTRTVNNKTPLRSSEIEFLKQLLSKLLNHGTFNMDVAKNELELSLQQEIAFDFNVFDLNNEFTQYLKTSKFFYDKCRNNLDVELNKYCTILNQAASNSETSFFGEISNACGIVVSNEYYFGQTVFPHSLAEQYSKDFSATKPKFIFACNFLTYNNGLNETISESSINRFNQEQQGDTPLVTSTIPSLTKSPSLCMMENKTFYTLNGQIISIYNKSSYYRENDNFLRQNALYYFGDGNDHNHSLSEDCVFFTQNVSTEICRDVACGIRRGDSDRKNFHIIQSNTIVPTSDNLPPADIFVYCDPSVAVVKDLSVRLSHVYKESFTQENACKPCYVASFNLEDKGFDISIYKIIDNS